MLGPAAMPCAIRDGVVPVRWRMLLTLAAISGCGGPNLYPVEGKVVFADGTPLAAGTVVFKPKDPKAVMSPRGIIRAAGKFRASTLKEGDGAPPGDYQVLIAPEAVIEAPP